MSDQVNETDELSEEDLKALEELPKIIAESKKPKKFKNPAMEEAEKYKMSILSPISESEKVELNNYKQNIINEINEIDVDLSHLLDMYSTANKLKELVDGFNKKVVLLNKTRPLSDNIISSEIFRLTNELYSLGTKNYEYTKLKNIVNKLSTVLQINSNDTSIIDPTDVTRVIYDELPDVIKLPKNWTGSIDNDDINMIYGLPVVIAAGTGVGKTTFMTNLIYQYFKKNKADNSKYNQWVFTLESKVQRLLIELLNIELKDTGFKGHTINFINTHKNIKEHVNKIDEYAKSITFYGNDNNSKDVDIEMIEKSIMYASIRGSMPDIVYIDYLQKIKNDPLLINSDRRLQIMDTMGRLTQLAKKYNFVIIINSQINRTDRKEKTQVNAETGNTVTLPPDLTSMSESSSIEHDAGLILAIGREFSSDRNDEDIFYIKIAKNRYGRTGKTYYCKVDKKTKYIIGNDPKFKAKLQSKSKSTE